MNEKALLQRFTTIDWGLGLTILDYAAMALLVINTFFHFLPQMYQWIAFGYIALVGIPYTIYFKGRQLVKEFTKRRNAL